MKDLDFDELDRAVNSLMGSVSKDDTKPTEVGEKTVEITPGAPEAPQPSTSTPVAVTVTSATPPTAVPATPAPKPAAPQRPSAPSLASRRGSGRFMDVVHPSSDMGKAENTPAPNPPISRQGSTIQPREGAEATVDAAIVPPKEASVSPAAVAQVESQAVQKSDWPDPLEMANFKEDPAAPTEEPTPAAAPEGNPTPSEEEPLSTPFLADAKVEKRPLGGATPPAEEPGHAPVLPGADESKTVNDPADQLPATTEPATLPLPEELQEDLVAVEADHTEGEPKVEEESPAPKPEPLSPVHVDAEKDDSKAAVSTGSGSILQQYKEEPSTGEKDNGAIYDTASYHQPLAHPAGGKPEWLWMVWIALILIVGVATGIALFMLGIV